MGVYLFAEDIIVSESAIKGIEGKFTENGTYNEKPCYKNGDYEIRYKGCRAKWVLVYKDTMYYRNMTDLDSCPLDGWLTACKIREISDTIPLFQASKRDSIKTKEKVK